MRRSTILRTRLGRALPGQQGMCSASWLLRLLWSLVFVVFSTSTAHAGLLDGLFPPPSGSSIQVVDYQPVSKTYVSGSSALNSKYDYVYKVKVRNAGNTPVSPTGQVTSKRSSVVVTDNGVSFGLIAVQATKLSSDTFTVRAGKFFDRRLDHRIVINGREVFEEAGSDPDDAGVLGLLQGLIPSLFQGWDNWLSSYYTTKFSLVFSWTFHQDGIAPTISGQSPKDTNVASPSAPIVAQYADESGIDTTKVSLTVDGQNVTASANRSATAISYQPAVKLSNGQHTVLLKIADMSGNPAESTWTFGVDAIGPIAASQQPINGAQLAADVIPAVSASYSDAGIGIEPTAIKLFIDGQDVSAASQITVTGISYTPPQALIEGAHSIKLVATDKNGNITESIWGFTTKTSPEITSVSPQDGFLKAGQSAIITAQYRDIGSGIDTTRVHLTLDGIDVTAQAQITAQGLTLTTNTPLADGVHPLVLTILDKAGNAASKQWQFTVDGGSPQITNTLPGANIWVNAVHPTISASFLDSGVGSPVSGIDTASIKLLFNGVDVTAQAVVAVEQINYVPTQLLADGEHSVVLQVADKAGNLAESSWRFRVDATAPALINLAPVEGASLPADALPTIKADFSDESAGIELTSVKLVLDNVDITAQATVSATGIIYTVPQALQEGAHTLRVIVVDKAANVATQAWVFTTATAPQIYGETPKDTFLPAAVPPTLTASYSDVGVGIASASVRLELDNVDVTAQAQITDSGVTYAAPQSLQDGTHTVKLTVADNAGNQTVSSWQFGTAKAPEISGLIPKDVILPPGSQPTISAQYTDARVGINTSSVRLIVNGMDVTAQSQITGTGVSYTPAAPLESGPVTMYLEVGNQTNGTAQTVWGFEVDTLATYTVSILDPVANSTVITPKVEVRVKAEANKTYATALTINGQTMRPASTDTGDIQYVATVALNDGANTLTINAIYADGQTRTASTVINYNAPPIVTITAPLDRAILGAANPSSPRDLTGNVERPVSITGRVNKPVTSVMVNQQRAVLTGGTEFRFDNFFLHEGTNHLTVVATDNLGRTGTSAIVVSVDQTAPILSVEHPLADSITSSSTIDVRGVVNDAVEGFVGAPEPTVTVNGVQAQVADRYYLATDVPLQIGVNTQAVITTDHAGNSRRLEFQVTRLAVGTDRLTLLSGNHQKAALSTELPKPLTIVALNRNGEPLANVPVSFDVLRGTGSISTTQGQSTKPDGVNPARNLVVNTDAAGRASVWLTTGRKTGVGANVVRAFVMPGAAQVIAEDVFFTATSERGLPAMVLPDMGINQYAELGTEPLEPLTAVIKDSEGNPLLNVPVTFRIEEGEAFLIDANGTKVQSLVVSTDRNGVAAVRPVLGQKIGTVQVSAKTVADPHNAQSGNIGQAIFLIQAREPKDGPTFFRGFVYTDKSEPMAGVRMSVGRTNLSVTTDETGAFVLESVPPGRIDLYVDARASTFQNKQWPALHFEVIAIRGQDNQLPHPIYLPPLAMSEAKWVGGSEDAILKIPGLEGFQMKVKANSVTFPDGSHEGMLVVSPVVTDRLPMSPPGGGSIFGQPAWTIQPSGARFDPPIEVTMPNVGGMRPGETAPVVQWDHDLGQYVPMGRATVTEDGAFLVTDAGTGVSKAGWGGCTDCPPLPTPQRCAAKCNDCEKEGNPAEGQCCIQKTADEIKFQVVQPASKASVEFNTDSNTYFDIKTSGLDKAKKTWKVSVKKQDVEIKSGVTISCEASCEMSNSKAGSVFSVGRSDCVSSNFSNGALITGEATAEVQTCSLKTEKQEFSLKAKNPSFETVKSFISGIESNPNNSNALIHFACHENRKRHFGSDGLPALNSGLDGGFGIMQVTDTAGRSCAALWDWRENVRQGRRIFNDKIAQSRRLINSEGTISTGYRANNELRVCLAETGQDWAQLVAEEKVVRLTDAEIAREALRGYNGGREHKWKLSDASNNYQDCSKGMWVSEPRTVGDELYVNKVLECE